MSQTFHHSRSAIRQPGLVLFAVLVGSLLWLALRTEAARAQSAAATQTVVVQGSVEDSTGAILAGATVRGHQGEKQVAEAVTAADGRFTLRLAPGDYSLEVIAPSFSPFSQNVTVRAPMAPLLFKLELAPVQQTMDVKDEPYQISLQPDQNSNSLVLDQTQIQQQMPDDEDELAALLQELAGPAANAVGGADIVTDGFTNGKVPPKNQIREIKINNNPFSSESSRPGQGRIEITTRAGSDSLRGNISYEVRDAALNARNAFANERPPYHRDDYRGNLSGPLIRDKMSFAASYRHLDTSDNDALQALTPNGVVNDPVLRPNSIRDYNGRIESQLPRNNFLNLALGWRSNTHQNEGVGGFTLPERATNSDNQEFSMQVRESAPLSERMVQELRFSLERNYSFTRPETSGFAINVQDSFNGGGATRHSDQTTYEYQFGDTLTYSRGKLGMKFGYQGNLQRFHIFSADSFNGTYVFSDLESYLAGRPTTFTQTSGTPQLDMSQYQSGEFVQTDYKLSRALMLSMGLRHEAQTSIGDHNNFDPRFGFAYGVGKDSVIRGGFGTFHQRLTASTVQGLMQLNGKREIQTVLLYCQGKVDANGVPTDAPDCVPPPGSLAALSNPFLFLPGGAGKAPPSVRRASATLALPYTANGSLSFETKLRKSTFVSATYDYVRGMHLYRTRNINAPQTGTADPLDPSFQNILLLESSASSRYQDLSVRLNQRLGSSANSLFFNYTLGYNRNDTDGVFALPADNYAVRGEWGRSADDQRHTVFAGMNYQLPWKISSSGRFRASSGRPYNITTGNDDNHDTITNDRPAGVGRNTGNGPGFFEIDLSLKKTFSLKPAPARKASQAAGTSPGGREAPSAAVRTEAPRGQGSAVVADSGGGRGRGGPQMSVTANISNLLNHTNFNKFSGVLTSPYFGRANSARDPRDIELVVQFTF